MPWQWPRGDPKMLAGFVNKQAGLYLPPLPFSTEDLRHFDPHNRVRRIAEAIYQVLADQNIYYGPSEYVPGAEETQIIRQPQEVLTYKRGTCLDLATLYCGACLHYSLLPVLLVFHGAPEGHLCWPRSA